MTQKVVVAIPHSHTWLWTQTAVAALAKYPPVADGWEAEIIVVDNSEWSPAIRGVTDTRLGDGVTVVTNTKPEAFHGSALDFVVETIDFDYLMAMETDVCPTSPKWLEWFTGQMEPGVFGVGYWHYEQFLNPSCTLYDGEVLRAMSKWCRQNRMDVMRWGDRFEKAECLDRRRFWKDYLPAEYVESIAGPFAEVRGWPEGTVLTERPSGQSKGPGWYEPGQSLYHWAVEHGHRAQRCVAVTANADGIPRGTFYGCEAPPPCDDWGAICASEAVAVHFWGGTRSLDMVKRDVTDETTRRYAETWIRREAAIWRQVVPADLQAQAVDLMKRYGWHYRDWLTGGDVQPEQLAGVETVLGIYRSAGVPI